MFVGNHLSKLQKVQDLPQGNVGRVPRDWAINVNPCNESKGNLPEARLNRAQLRCFCRTMANSAEDCFLACMAWGGMNLKHGRSMWERRTSWVPTLEKLRTEEEMLSRDRAFRELHELRTACSLPGMRAPYFTKLIFFLRPVADGYIMDQWTAKSVNLLVGRDVVKLDRNGYVTDENGAEDYETFCQTIDCLRVPLGKQFGHEVEEKLMSEGHGKGEWRNYVIANWRAPTLVAGRLSRPTVAQDEPG